MLSSGSKPYNPNNDVEVATLDDDIAHMTWSPTADFLAAGTWSNKVCLYEMQRSTGQTMQKHQVAHNGPVMTTGWSSDGTKLFSGSCDKQVKMTDLMTGQTVTVAQHDAPVSTMKVFTSPQMGQMLLTGSWDKTIKYWDLRQSSPALSVPMPERVYCLDIAYPVLAVGLAERNVMIYNLDNPTQLARRMESLLKYPPRCIAAFPNRNGFAAGSIEGRVTIQNFEEPQEEARKSFSFKCHREPDRSNECYPVNSIVFHPSPQLPSVFATVGSDGWYSFWDKDTKSRLYKPNFKLDNSISACAFSYDGAIFAYTNSYDWHKGHAYNTPTLKHMILAKQVTEDMLRPRPKK